MTVHAAGGVVWRHTGATIEALVVHRPTHDDWTFPKGKTERGDADLETTARREVLEESGHRCTGTSHATTCRTVERRDPTWTGSRCARRSAGRAQPVERRMPLQPAGV